jgi:hypothetical protein
MPLAVLTTPDYLTRKSSWVTHIPFAFRAVELLRPRSFVELGAYHGDSYCAFCQAFENYGLQTRSAAIDTWEGDAQQGAYGSEVLERLRAYHDPRYGKFSRLIKGCFDEALPSFADGSIDLLHIDGFHSYDAVRHDYETWKSKVSERGVILFHDTAVVRPGFGVHQFWKEVAGEYPSFAFRHGSGLGILAVGGEVPEAFLRFLQRMNRMPRLYRLLFRVLGYRIRRMRRRGA